MSLMILIYTVAVLALIGAIFWPHSGIFWRLRRSAKNTQRVLVEDALKHLYDQEYKGLRATLQSISGALAISDDTATKLMARLEALGMVESGGDGFDLTSEGRSYALRMIRVHRLWERYLADQTGLKETEWHRKAEKLEHHMSDQEVDALAARAGHPSYDPHGDPIPTRTGKLPPKKGHPITDLQEGEIAQIVHIEDEPDAIYAQLVAERLHPGMQIRLIEKSPHRLTFVAEGEEIVLAPVVAANITVEQKSEAREDTGPRKTLTSLDIGDSAEVIGISKACRGLQRRRLMDLGIIPGTIVSAEMKSVGGDPTAYKIRGATIALRRDQADLVQIKPQEAA